MKNNKHEKASPDKNYAILMKDSTYRQAVDSIDDPETKEAVENMIAQYVNVLAKIFENETPVKKLTAQRPEDNENV